MAHSQTPTEQIPAGSPFAPTLDHLVIAVPDLAAGIAEFAELSGAEAVPGGSHPGLGTANALLRIRPVGWGADALTYLEIIGPDPEQDPASAASRLQGVTGMTLQRWAVHPEDFDATVASARAAGVDLGEVHDMSRATPDGGTLEWRLTRRAPLALGGVQPFLIDWLDSPHPALVDAPLVELVDFEALAPDVEATRAALAALGAAVMPVHEGDHHGLRATFRSPNGEFTVLT
ncbi:VOC family protein [Brevibacterium samyangense]|uniref:VOC family protein n=1 Tax=Brevibacterium samyangense TaxID=366888 RepID=A0ABP5EFI4_9MICO